MSFFQEDTVPKPTDLASRVGAVMGNIFVAIAYLIVIYPVVRSLMR
jgi:hypothetical protein